LGITHDELLAKISDLCDNCLGLMAGATLSHALRAVVELHKPSPIPDWVPTEEELVCWCAHIYPCPTIQAIVKSFDE
jgi:hypothetical protein